MGNSCLWGFQTPIKMKTPFLSIAACSYEGSLFGWDVIEDSENCSLGTEMKYGFSCCQQSLKAVAVSNTGKYLACGGMDERIRIFDAKEHRSLGEVSNQGGAITCLAFFGDSFLISGSEVTFIFQFHVE